MPIPKGSLNVYCVTDELPHQLCSTVVLFWFRDQYSYFNFIAQFCYWIIDIVKQRATLFPFWKGYYLLCEIAIAGLELSRRYQISLSCCELDPLRQNLVLFVKFWELLVVGSSRFQLEADFRLRERLRSGLMGGGVNERGKLETSPVHCFGRFITFQKKTSLRWVVATLLGIKPTTHMFFRSQTKSWPNMHSCYRLLAENITSAGISIRSLPVINPHCRHFSMTDPLEVVISYFIWYRM